MSATAPLLEPRVAHTFAAHYRSIAMHPSRGFAALAADARRLRYGAMALSSNAIGYTFVYVFLVLGHGRPTVFRPWLAIDPEVYYRWNVVLLAPSMAMGWLLAGAVAQLAARALGGRGAFEDTLAALGFGTAIASWTTLLHDLVTTFLGAAHVIDQRWYEDAMSSATVFQKMLWLLMTAYLVAFVTYYARGLEAVHRLTRGRSLFVGAIAFAVYQITLVIFNR
jgi:hypothetical protein